MLPSPADYLAARQERASAFASSRALPTTLLELAQAFGDFGDLQSPLARGHSRAVAALASQTCAQLGLSAEEQRVATLAAHLHDLGQVAVPTSIWTMARVYRPTERERAHAHAFFTERILASAPPLADVARVAGAHHERLDGSGYHRAWVASALSRPARVLAACDVLSALQENRPHRPAVGLNAAATELRAMARAGQLDATCVEAVLAVAGLRTARAGAVPLSEREVEVLRGVARGLTNKEIAVQLGISPRTVQHHTIHIYEKLGVDTRAAAAVRASQLGLLC
jgi:HD-GYP domain-containing protein (c-di-GMP phosphodiesterase class II)